MLALVEVDDSSGASAIGYTFSGVAGLRQSHQQAKFFLRTYAELS
jgi:hypothetical protein